jgi:nitrate/nitrite-specific signal transduction histidine kinase
VFSEGQRAGWNQQSLNAGLRRAFARPRAEFEKISASVQRARNELDKLSPLADAFRAQAREFEARAEALAMARDRVSDRIGRIVEIIGYVMVVLGLWAMLTYLLWIQNRLATGWHMLRQGTGTFIRR